MQHEIRRKCFEIETSLHLHDLRLTSRWLTRSHDDAEHLVQETLVKANEAWQSSLSKSGCRVLLFKVMTWLFFNGFQRRPASFFLSCQGNIDVTIARDRFALAHEVSRNSHTRMIVRLPVEIRYVRLLSKLKRFFPAEIAEIIELEQNTTVSSSSQGSRLLQAESFTYSGQG